MFYGGSDCGFEPQNDALKTADRRTGGVLVFEGDVGAAACPRHQRREVRWLPPGRAG